MGIFSYTLKGKGSDVRPKGTSRSAGCMNLPCCSFFPCLYRYLSCSYAVSGELEILQNERTVLLCYSVLRTGHTPQFGSDFGKGEKLQIEYQ